MSFGATVDVFDDDDDDDDDDDNDGGGFDGEDDDDGCDENNAGTDPSIATADDFPLIVPRQCKEQKAIQ